MHTKKLNYSIKLIIFVAGKILLSGSSDNDGAL